MSNPDLILADAHRMALAWTDGRRCEVAGDHAEASVQEACAILGRERASAYLAALSMWDQGQVYVLPSRPSCARQEVA